MRNIREDQAKQELNYKGELTLYPKHLVLVESWNPEVEKELNARDIPNALVKGSHYGTVQVLRIFTDSVKL